MVSLVTSTPFPALIAASFGFPEVLQVTSAYKLRSRRGKHGESCVHFAAWAGQTDAIQMLLAIGGVDLGLQDTDGLSALHIASMLGYEDKVTVLLRHIRKEEILLKDNDGDTALLLSAFEGNDGIVSKLVGQREPVDLSLVNAEGHSALHFAVRGRNSKKMELMFQRMRP